MKLLLRLVRIVPLILGVVFFLKRGKKTAALEDEVRDALAEDIVALTTIAESGEAEDRRNAARETAERLRAAGAREQVNQNALRKYQERRKAFGDTIPGNAATDKGYDGKLKDLRDAAGKLAAG